LRPNRGVEHDCWSRVAGRHVCAGDLPICLLVAQLTMVPVALFAARLAEARGYWPVFLLALIALPVRGVVASLMSGGEWGL
jgi:hypothetical protein